MSDFTPGPWKAVRITNPGRAAAAYYIYGANAKGKGVRCVAHVKNSTIQPLHANARLIAAAPEMLEALIMIRDADNDCEKDGLQRIPSFARGKIDAAIAKAEGPK